LLLKVKVSPGPLGIQVAVIRGCWGTGSNTGIVRSSGEKGGEEEAQSDERE